MVVGFVSSIIGNTINDFIDTALTIVVILIVWYIIKFFLVAPPTEEEKKRREAEWAGRGENVRKWLGGKKKRLEQQATAAKKEKEEKRTKKKRKKAEGTVDKEVTSKIEKAMAAIDKATDHLSDPEKAKKYVAKAKRYLTKARDNATEVFNEIAQKRAPRLINSAKDLVHLLVQVREDTDKLKLDEKSLKMFNQKLGAVISYIGQFMAAVYGHEGAVKQAEKQAETKKAAKQKTAEQAARGATRVARVKAKK